MEEFLTKPIVATRDICSKCICSFGNWNGYDLLVTGFCCHPILCVIILMIYKSDSHFAVVWFCQSLISLQTEHYKSIKWHIYSSLIITNTETWIQFYSWKHNIIKTVWGDWFIITILGKKNSSIWLHISMSVYKSSQTSAFTEKS